jgi:hypothetical protein
MRSGRFIVLVILFMGLGMFGLAGCGSEQSRDAFGADPSASSTQPAFLVADPSVSLRDVDQRVIARQSPDAGSKAYYTFLPYVLPAGFQPAMGWGDEKTGEFPNPATSGRFYAAAFTDGKSVIRLAVNPEDAPDSISWTLPPGGLDWTKTGAGCMQREAYEAVRQGIDYFRVTMPDDVIYVYGPQGQRKYIWSIAEGIAPALIGGPLDERPTLSADFDFVLRYGVGGKNVLDTAAGTFTKDMVPDPAVTTDLSLTSDELRQVYEWLREIDFWGYPENLNVSSQGSGTGTSMTVTPSTDYGLAVSGTGLTHSTTGNDLQYSPDLRNVALWKLIERVQKIIQAKDAYKALPSPRGGYA